MKTRVLLCLAAAFFLAAAPLQAQSPVPFQPAAGPLWGNDVIISDIPAEDQRDVCITTAFNGWIYAAYSYASFAGGTGNIVLMRSDDNGQSWSELYRAATDYVLPSHLDIIAAGSSTGNLKIYMAYVTLSALTGGTWDVYVDRFNGVTGEMEANVFGETNGLLEICDVAIATDNLFPATGANPYTPGLAFTRRQMNYNEVIFTTSNGGGSFADRRNVTRTVNCCRDVDVSYARSLGNPDGRYFVTWSEFSGQTAVTGHIMVAHTALYYNDPFLSPARLDDGLLGVEGYCRAPRIAVQQNNASNLGGGMTAVIVFERAADGDLDNRDVLGFCNLNAAFSDDWELTAPASAVESSEIQPDLCFEPGTSMFYVTYFDSTGQKLVTKMTGMDLVPADPWEMLVSQYNDAPGLTAPWPRVDVSPAWGMPAHVWISGPEQEGTALFDAQFAPVPIGPEMSGTGHQVKFYPNPASYHGTMEFVLPEAGNVRYRISDLRGSSLIPYQVIPCPAGVNQLGIDIGAMPPGLYILQLITGTYSRSLRIIVSRY